jgi:hypothetical protein
MSLLPNLPDQPSEWTALIKVAHVTPAALLSRILFSTIGPESMVARPDHS